MRKMGSVPVFLDETHDPDLRSWVESANAPICDFPIQNLPFGIFRRKNSKEKRRAGVAIGDQIFDLAALGVKSGPTLNGIAAMGRPAWKRLRKEISTALVKEKRRFEKHLVPMRRAELFLPVTVGDYTDFYTSVFHATNVGRLFRPDNPLLPNYKWLPIGYHGRASSVIVSGTPVIRPCGQTKSPDQANPSFGPSKPLGKRIPLQEALDHVFGVVLLNDWSARDIQAWEYQPLGPFLAKSFGTTISPWVVTLEALAPYRCPAFARPAGDPQPLPYLFDEADSRAGGFSIEVEMYLRSARMRASKRPPMRLSRGNYNTSYWTPAQLIAHHSSNGCNLQPGDLVGSEPSP